jgi:hypothetical protein
VRRVCSHNTFQRHDPNDLNSLYQPLLLKSSTTFQKHHYRTKPLTHGYGGTFWIQTIAGSLLIPRYTWQEAAGSMCCSFISLLFALHRVEISMFLQSGCHNFMFNCTAKVQLNILSIFFLFKV